MEDLAALDARLGQLLAAVGDDRRRQLARRIAIALRKSEAERIAAQKNPDGSAFEPRKPQPQHRNKRGRIKRMFDAIRSRRHLKATSDAKGATVGFSGRTGRIARVHQEGLIDAVNRRNLKVRYPVRTLLGFSTDDIRTIRDAAIDHLGP